MFVEFTVGEKCVCMHKNVAYISKITKIQEIRGVKYYFVHYEGWSKNRDEKIPVGSDRLFKGTMEEFKQNHPGVNADESRPALMEKNKRKRKADPVVEDTKEDADVFALQAKKPHFSIEWPKEMLSIVIFDQMVANEKPVELIARLPPNGQTVNDIVKAYMEFLGVPADSMEETENQILQYNENGVSLSNLSLAHSAQGLLALFNAIHNSQLIRAEEKDKFYKLYADHAMNSGLSYEEIRKKPVENGFYASKHFGIVHFLRMFSIIEKKCVPDMKPHVIIGANRFLQFLENNRDQFFDEEIDYEPIPIKEEKEGEGTSSS
ncbi:hypothetical protein CRE_14640 [Caenorhabditis remanei]|uniref:Uncharacterized protein n=1 Tax=Caenorhabditis remanei TaxID=31234 RepID=E3M998_CAERE|nr:hypothetical protein CRE_14640 [Caenorhabditis remanei]